MTKTLSMSYVGFDALGANHKRVFSYIEAPQVDAPQATPIRNDLRLIPIKRLCLFLLTLHGKYRGV